jgi:glycosyltransferase involved in cell wall biosynthesis
VGILSYNYARYVIDTLDSVLTQTYPHIELVIVDDHSPDNSVALIREWIKEKKITCNLILHEANQGICKSCNDIVRAAAGKYLALFASDDIMNPLRIEKQVAVMEEHNEETALCYSEMELIDEDGVPAGLRKTKNNIKEGYLFEEFIAGQVSIPAPSVLLRKSVFEKTGLYDERLAAEDYGMWMKIVPFFKIAFCDYAGVKYRTRINTKQADEQIRKWKERHHYDRIIIYQTAAKLVANEKKFKQFRRGLVKRINYHLLRLRYCQSVFFGKSLLYVLVNLNFNFQLGKMISLYIKQKLFGLKPDYGE